MKSIYTVLILSGLLSISIVSPGAKLFTLIETKAPSNPDSAMVAVPAVPTIRAIPDFAEAFKELKSLSRAERRDRIKTAKKEIKAFKAAKKAGNAPSTNTVLLVILAILLPPLAVYLHEGVINTKFWIDLVLTLLFFIPGVIYALIVVLGNG